MILCKDRADFAASVRLLLVIWLNAKVEGSQEPGGRMPVRSQEGRPSQTGGLAMRLMIEIAAAALLLSCISATSAAFAAGKAGKSADSLSCSFSTAKDASPAARCAAIKRQCGGKFHANYCGDKLLSAM